MVNLILPYYTYNSTCLNKPCHRNEAPLQSKFHINNLVKSISFFQMCFTVTEDPTENMN